MSSIYFNEKLRITKFLSVSDSHFWSDNVRAFKAERKIKLNKIKKTWFHLRYFICGTGHLKWKDKKKEKWLNCKTDVEKAFLLNVIDG